METAADGSDVSMDEVRSDVADDDKYHYNALNRSRLPL